MLKLLIKSLKKSSRLKRISKRLSKPLDRTNIRVLLDRQQTREKYLDELLDLCKSDENVFYLIKTFDITDCFLKTIFHALEKICAGQYAGGHYVPASSITYASTLKFLLNHFDGQNFSIKNYDHYNSSLFIAHRLIMYFDKGETGEVKF